MLIPLSRLESFHPFARNGPLGPVRDFVFDDERWQVHHLVISTASWMGRDVVVSPAAVSAIDGDRKALLLALSRREVELSPGPGSAPPLTRQEAESYPGYYGWPSSWAGSGFISFGTRSPSSPEPHLPIDPPLVPRRSHGDPHLRSYREVTGYHMRAKDGSLGHLEDLLVESGSFRIRFLVVDTRNFWPGKKVLVPPRCVRGLDWRRRTVVVGLWSNEIKSAPPYRGGSPSRADEHRIFAHYGLDTSSLDEAGTQPPAG